MAGIKARTAKQETLAAHGEKLANTELAHLDEQEMRFFFEDNFTDKFLISSCFYPNLGGLF